MCPPRPPQLTCTVASPTSVTLNWGAAAGATSYQIERATSGAFAQVGTSTTTSFTNTGLTTNTAYQYRVRAANSAGTSHAVDGRHLHPGQHRQPPGTPGTPTTSAVTASSVTLNWAASTGTVTNYQVERATGATSTTFTQVGTSTTTSFTNTALAASTTYRFRVRATNSAGNSAYSGIVNVTTTTGGTGGGCSATLTLQTGWGGGYVMQPVTVTNTGTSSISGWTVTFTLPAGHAITNSWNATVTVSGQTVTARGIAGQTANLGAGASANWGFQATRPTSDNSLPSGATCTSP